MLTVDALQTALPLILILWLTFLPPRSLAGLWMLAFATAAMILAAAKLRIWVIWPWWVPYLPSLGLVDALTLQLVREPERCWLSWGPAD